MFDILPKHVLIIIMIIKIIAVMRTLILVSSTGNSYTSTARKIGFALFLIRIKDEVKYNNIFDNAFDAHQKYVKYVTPLHIPLTRIKVSSNVLTTLTLPLTRVKLKSNNFDYAYDAHQRWIKYVISLQISLIRIKFDYSFDARESNVVLVTCVSNQR